MNLGIILLGIVGLVIVLALVHVVTKMSSERESAGRRRDAARHKPERIVTLTGDTVKHLGHS
jgi:hypothetical protein